jgi:hypothetical protein
VLAVNVCPTCAVPETVGNAVFDGGDWGAAVASAPTVPAATARTPATAATEVVSRRIIVEHIDVPCELRRCPASHEMAPRPRRCHNRPPPVAAHKTTSRFPDVDANGGDEEAEPRST